jgi:hypothetical protein
MPVRFDIARQVRVFNAYLQYVELKLTGAAIQSWRESGHAVFEGHHTGRVGGQCTATRGVGYQA